MRALFEHHRDLVPRELEVRLLPMCIRQPEEPVTIKRSVFKKKPPQLVIYLPDLSNAAPTETPATQTKNMAECLIDEVCYRHKISPSDLTGKGRNPALIAARHEASYLIAVHTNISIAGIGRLLHKDHTTILHSIMRYCDIHDLPRPRGNNNVRFRG